MKIRKWGVSFGIFGIGAAILAGAVAVLSRVLAFKVQFLITDVAVWALVGGLSLFLLYARTREEYRIAWKQLKVRRLAILCGGIVCVFAAVGMLDSFHFQRRLADQEAYETEVISLLDVLAWTLKSNTETTFSAPLATHAFSKEMIENPDGTHVYDYKRLVHGGAHLKNTEEAWSDILGLAVKGLWWGAAMGAILLSLLLGIVKLAEGPLRSVMGVGLFLLLFFALAGAIAFVSTQYHVLGTDKIGQDVLYRALKGCRTGLVVGTITTLIVTPFALLFGIPAGYFGGKIDDVIQYVYTTVSSIPDILLIAAVMLIVQAGLTEEQTVFAADRRLWWLCVILGVTGWTELCRLLRAETLKIREVEYVQAAHAFGVSDAKIMLRHIVPNVMHIVLISVMLRFSGLVLFEAVLAYVGIGVDPSTESWGNLVNSARLELARDPLVWWSLLAAFLFMFGLVLPANIFGDAVRDALDPRLRTK